MLSLILALSLSAQAACTPRESFPAFVVRFKSDPAFRAVRIRFPLPVEYQGEGWGPGHPTRVELDAARWEVEAIHLVTAEREAALAGSEGELCESSSGSLDERLLFQQSCDSDAYGNTFHFRRDAGCWMLEGVELGGS